MLEKWVARNGCPAKAQAAETVRGRPGHADAAHTATRHGYLPCRDGTEVVLWKLTGAGHVWPGGVQDYLPWLLGPGTTVIDANSEMWRFFSRFRRLPP
jgi:poly(3-hydroxybutyrate) depolymerase